MTSQLGEESEENVFTNEDLNCRFYRNELPKRDELVMVEIVKINNNEGAYVRLLEYNNVEGLILASSLAAKRIKNVK